MLSKWLGNTHTQTNTDTYKHTNKHTDTHTHTLFIHKTHWVPKNKNCTVNYSRDKLPIYLMSIKIWDDQETLPFHMKLDFNHTTKTKVIPFWQVLQTPSITDSGVNANLSGFFVSVHSKACILQHKDNMEGSILLTPDTKHRYQLVHTFRTF